MARILIIDDNPAIISALDLLFDIENWKTASANAPDEGLALLRDGGIDLVIQDMNFTSDTTSGAEGEALFRQIRQEFPGIPVVLLTAWTDVETAVRLVKDGAADYQGKPWDDERMVTTVRNLLQLSQARQRVDAAHRGRQQAMDQLHDRFDLRDFIFASQSMLNVVSLACKVARAPVPVLITGPSGVGKTRLAEVIHRNSDRAAQPFVSVNAGALPRDLIEAELFGAEAGAYTGAQKARAGRFQAADGGTLFLDEIGNLSAEGQMKLLRVLETGEFERLGSNQTLSVDVRLISATNSDLTEAIEEGRFREDLFYRLNLIEIDIPPLAARKEDILPTANALLGQQYSLSDQAQDAMQAHEWPGNVRELSNALQRAQLLCEGRTIAPEHLGLASVPRSRGVEEEPDRKAPSGHSGQGGRQYLPGSQEPGNESTGAVPPYGQV